MRAVRAIYEITRLNVKLVYGKEKNIWKTTSSSVSVFKAVNNNGGGAVSDITLSDSLPALSGLFPDCLCDLGRFLCVRQGQCV